MQETVSYQVVHKKHEKLGATGWQPAVQSQRCKLLPTMVASQGLDHGEREIAYYSLALRGKCSVAWSLN